MIQRTGFLVAVALMVGTVGASAHNGIEHLLGTVTAVAGSSITVETVKHTSVTVTVDAATVFTHSGGKSALKDLKVGERVAINAKESADKKLVAVTVKWGAGAGAAGHTEHP